MITYIAAAKTAAHYDRRGEYAIADALLLLIKANLRESDARVLGALEGSTAALEGAEVARRASLPTPSVLTCLRRLRSYGLATSAAHTQPGRNRPATWRAVRFGPPASGRR